MPLRAMKEYIPAGWPGTRRTLQRMSELAAQDAQNWGFIRAITAMTQGARHRDQIDQMKRVFRYVKKKVAFIPDPRSSKGEGVELVQAPLKTLQRRGGDCDDFAILMASAAMALGMPAKFVVIKANKKMPTEFSHVYSEVFANGRWFPLDPTVKSSKPGWAPKAYWGKTEWAI